MKMKEDKELHAMDKGKQNIAFVTMIIIGEIKSRMQFLNWKKKLREPKLNFEKNEYRKYETIFIGIFGYT